MVLGAPSAFSTPISLMRSCVIRAMVMNTPMLRQSKTVTWAAQVFSVNFPVTGMPSFWSRNYPVEESYEPASSAASSVSASSVTPASGFPTSSATLGAPTLTISSSESDRMVMSKPEV